MAHARFTIRYRLPGPVPALLVEEATGALFTVAPDGVRSHLGGAGVVPALDARLRRRGWVPVPAVAPYSLAELRRLLDSVAA